MTIPRPRAGGVNIYERFTQVALEDIAIKDREIKIQKTVIERLNYITGQQAVLVREWRHLAAPTLCEKIEKAIGILLEKLGELIRCLLCINSNN